MVLRESAEIVRMERGLIISRTKHGFVCANAGVDASNTGRGEWVTLLPDDPDRSAREIRDRLAEPSASQPTEVPAVIVSDSFGRPWRFGIVDVALGVAGIEPLVDLRDTPDADGRIMHSTVVAACRRDLLGCGACRRQDERPAGRPGPWRRVQSSRSGSGESEPSVVRDVVMPPEMDLFK